MCAVRDAASDAGVGPCRSDAVRSVYTTARLAAAEAPLREGVAYLAACASLKDAGEDDAA
jgi:hypothetical protein